MVNENLISLIENKKPVELVQEIDNKYEIPSVITKVFDKISSIKKPSPKSCAVGCSLLYAADCAICTGLSSGQARALCYARAAERYANCLRGANGLGGSL